MQYGSFSVWVAARPRMGRPAHARPPGAARYSPLLRKHDDLTGEIGALLATSPRDLALIERRLTDAYAAALSLEGERWRLERRLGAVAATADADEVSELTRRIECSEASLQRLRAGLARLRGEYSEAVAVAGRSAAGRRRRRRAADRR